MTRFVLELKGPADGPLSGPGIAQSKVIVGLEPEITAVIEKAKALGLILTGEPRFVPEHKKAPATPPSPAPTGQAIEPPAEVLDSVTLPPATAHGRRHGQAAAAD